MESREEKCIEFALHAYDTFWNYYKKTLDERNQILNSYIIFVGIPVSVVGIYIDKIKDNISDYTNWFVFALVIILFLGIIIFDAYIVESFISEKYLHKIKQIVEYLEINYDSKYNEVFNKVYTLDGLFLNNRNSQKHRLRKSAIIFVINTVIISGIFCLISKINLGWCSTIISFFLSIFIHGAIVLYLKMEN